MSITQKLVNYLANPRPDLEANYHTYEQRMRETGARMERLKKLAELRRREARE